MVQMKRRYILPLAAYFCDHSKEDTKLDTETLQ